MLKVDGKIVVIDWSVFMFKAILTPKDPNTPFLTVDYNCFKMILSYLRKIGIDPQDEIIIACDGRGNWRKGYEEEYKGNRAEQREKQTHIDWDDGFARANALKERLERGTYWHFVQLPGIEADDIASVICRKFPDNKIILVSIDADWEQLWDYGDRIRIISPHAKVKGYKIKPEDFNVYKFLAKKTVKETADNLVTEISSVKEYDSRKTCVNLLELPEVIENQVSEAIEKLEPKEENIDYIPFPNSLRGTYENLYNDKKAVIDYEDWKRKKIKRDERKKKAKKKKSIMAKEMEKPEFKKVYNKVKAEMKLDERGTPI